MNRANSKKRKLSKRGKKPHTYRRIVTGNVNGRSVVQSEEPLSAYQFKTVPGYEHTLIWVNPATPDLSKEQRFDCLSALSVAAATQDRSPGVIAVAFRDSRRIYAAHL